ncbi:hypothetical protein JL722_14864 [Aureococcus anophagefferens]|nr:hypothetical protein JL722_14864 [Aureococcus anophagefferens]
MDAAPAPALDAAPAPAPAPDAAAPTEEFTVDENTVAMAPFDKDGVECDTKDAEDLDVTQTLLGLWGGRLPGLEERVTTFACAVDSALLAAWVKQPSPCCAPRPAVVDDDDDRDDDDDDDDDDGEPPEDDEAAPEAAAPPAPPRPSTAAFGNWGLIHAAEQLARDELFDDVWAGDDASATRASPVDEPAAPAAGAADAVAFLRLDPEPLWACPKAPVATGHPLFTSLFNKIFTVTKIEGGRWRLGAGALGTGAASSTPPAEVFLVREPSVEGQMAEGAEGADGR